MKLRGEHINFCSGEFGSHCTYFLALTADTSSDLILAIISLYEKLQLNIWKKLIH